MIMAIFGYRSVFITKSKYTFENTVYCILPEVENVILLVVITM